jgi:hypothetical protein
LPVRLDRRVTFGYLAHIGVSVWHSPSALTRATSGKNGVAMPDGDYQKFCRSGYQRKPQFNTMAVTRPDGVRFKSNLAWRNYKAAEATHDPADADHFVKAFTRFLRDTSAFRSGRKIEATRHRGSAHCHKAHWLMERKGFTGHECLFFPSMLAHRPERVKYNCRNMAAARAMLLMTQGLPPEGEAYATHICGNGHLSCVNPEHLKWGSPADNAKDAVVHNAQSEFIAGMDSDTVANIRTSPDMVKVIAWKTGIPAGVVSAIKLGEQFTINQEAASQARM